MLLAVLFNETFIQAVCEPLKIWLKCLKAGFWLYSIILKKLLDIDYIFGTMRRDAQAIFKLKFQFLLLATTSVPAQENLKEKHLKRPSALLVKHDFFSVSIGCTAAQNSSVPLLRFLVTCSKFFCAFWL